MTEAYSDDRKRAVRQAQEWLYGIALDGMPLPLLVPDGIYGEKTRDAVKIFQGLSGIGQTGVIDYVTWLTLRDAYDGAYRKAEISHPIYPFEYTKRGEKVARGDRTSLVTIIQIMVETLLVAYNTLGNQPENGVFDAVTSANIAKLQEIWSLPSTGEVDLETWNKLADSYNKYLNAE